ncbi:MAG: WYL domain-containing protein [Balneolaceae bacterium]
MPVNRNALIRYRTIDKCLRNRQRVWLLNDLIYECSEALYEYEGIEKGVSRRTVQADIQIMRSDKLGYNAPIIVKEKKYYTYSDPDYTITNIPLTDQDIGTLNEVVEILKQFKGFSHFEDMDGMIKRLEDKVYTSRSESRSIIDFEKIEGLKGLHFLDELYQAILKEKVIKITYQSFKARKPGVFDFHPQFLKEFNNRWFLLGVKNKDSYMMNLALDRIVKIDASQEVYAKLDITAKEYFKDVVGVTVSQTMRPRLVRIFVERSMAPYVLTKPIHPSQKLEQKVEGGIIVTFTVQLNFELEAKILSFGNSMKVLAPENLITRINKRLRLAVKNYNDSSYPITSSP